MKDKLYEEIDRRITTGQKVNVLIAGMTCSGKSTLAREIQEHYVFGKHPKQVSIISQDCYFKNLGLIPRNKGGYLMDSLYAFHADEYRAHAQYLTQHGTVRVPQYDIARNKRTAEYTKIENGDINIFEGLHSIRILSGLWHNVKVYLDTDVETCLERRIARDTSLYDVPEERIREYWAECIMPLSREFIFPQKEMADWIIS
ncbi:MAG: AAA family ATPase [Clostridia bacterium]|nr:AAA family ATPase [Clostridia bacterium]